MIPWPKTYIYRNEFLSSNAVNAIHCEDDLDPLYRQFSHEWAVFTGKRLARRQGTQQSGDCQLRLDVDMEVDSYRLMIQRDGIEIVAGSKTALSQGWISVLQLLQPVSLADKHYQLP